TKLYEGILYAMAVVIGYFRYRKSNKRPDWFHVFVLTRAAVLPYLLSFFKNDFYVSEAWSRYLPESNNFSGFFRKWLARKIVSRAKGVSVVSNSLKNAMISHGLNSINFQVINSVVPANFFMTKGLSRNSTIVKFLHVSCFDNSVKNISGILNAFKLVQARDFKFNLELVGTGSDFSAMVDYAKDIQVNNVAFSGELTGGNLVNAYHSNDVLVVFSNFETQGCVILEAHACGMPVIATAVGGIPELIAEENGVLVSPQDVKGLANAIIDIINGKYNFNSEKIRKQACLKYSRQAIVQQFFDFYEK
ncbi:MAG: glycosyltransferase, partial [Flavobacteriales bacterium]